MSLHILEEARRKFEESKSKKIEESDIDKAIRLAHEAFELFSKAGRRNDADKAKYRYHVLIRRKIDKLIGACKDEDKRKRYREELKKNAEEACEYFSRRRNWMFYAWLGDYYKICAIIEKSNGNYTRSIELIKEARKYYEEVKERKPDEHRQSPLYCDALMKEILAQQRYLEGNFEDVMRYYKEAAELYKKNWR